MFQKNVRINNKKLKLFLVIIVLIIAGIICIYGNKLEQNESDKGSSEQFYEIAVQIRDQKNNDPLEDVRSSLKAGDVLIVQKDGHSWSMTEKTSYLILKIKLTEEQVIKLTQSDKKEIKSENLTEEERECAEQNGEEYAQELQMETVRLRKYHIDMNEFEGFEPKDLSSGQPYLDKIYGWEIVKEK